MSLQDLRIKRSQLLLIFLIAFSLRLAYVLYTNNDSTSLNNWQWGDEGADIALNMLNGRGYLMSYGLCIDVRSFRMPLVPLLLFGIWSVVGYSLLAAKVVMVTISSATCVLVAILAQRLFCGVAAIISGVIAACFPNMIYWTATLGPETITAFLLVLCALVISWSTFTRRYLVAGVVIGLLILTRPVYIPYAAALFAIILFRSGNRLNWSAAVQ